MRKLRRLRAEKGLTMDALEERTGVSKRTISEIERGMRVPQALTLAKIARALGVDIDELTEEEAPKVESPSGSPSPETETAGAGLEEASARLQTLTPRDRRIMAYVTSPDRILAFLDEILKGEMLGSDAESLVNAHLKDLGLLGLLYPQVFDALTLHDDALRKKVERDVRDKQDVLQRSQGRRNAAESDTA